MPAESKDEVLRTVYSKAGLESEANGIAFSVPVTNAVGLTGFSKTKETES